MAISSIEKCFLDSLWITSPNFFEKNVSDIVFNDDKNNEISYTGICVQNDIECHSWKNLYCSVFIGEGYIEVRKNTRVYSLRTLKNDDGTMAVRYMDDIIGVQTWVTDFVQKKSNGEFLTITTLGIRPSDEIREDISCSNDQIKVVRTYHGITEENCYASTDNFFNRYNILISSIGTILYNGAIELNANSEDYQDITDPESSRLDVHDYNIWGMQKVMHPISK